jgi:nitroimidazol reductase NimA-like FMN-containing flavoprotein (pyridoxamine 5'-phosphate oxidase superfamily)
MGEAQAPTERTRLRRLPENAAYDRATIDAILDEALLCHFGFVHEGQPFVLPTLQARVGDEVFVHGSAASRMLRTVGAGVPACLTVTLFDGLVLARSVFEHSVNYRSVMLLGTARPVEGDGRLLAALHAFSERLVPGRWDEVRKPSPQELRATTLLAMPIDEVSAKVRTGPPDDGESPDAALDVWAGVVPAELRFLDPVPDPTLRPGIRVPDSVTRLLASD